MANSIENAKQLLRELGSALKLDKLELDQSNTARLVFDDVLTVDFEADPEAPFLHAYAVLGALPSEPQASAKLLEGLLAESLVMPGELPARVVVDRSIGMILLTVPIPVSSTEFEPFERKIGALVNLTEDWMTRLRRGEFGASDKGAQSQDASSDEAGHRTIAV